MLALKDAFLYLACAHAQMCIIILTNRVDVLDSKKKHDYARTVLEIMRDTACIILYLIISNSV